MPQNLVKESYLVEHSIGNLNKKNLKNAKNVKNCDFRKKVLDQSGPYIKPFPTNIRSK